MASSATKTRVEREADGRETRGRVVATRAGEEVGWLDFCDYDGVMVIGLIRAVPEGQGIGRAMLTALREAFPASVLSRHHRLNEAGRGLMASRTYHELKEPTA